MFKQKELKSCILNKFSLILPAFKFILLILITVMFCNIGVVMAVGTYPAVDSNMVLYYHFNNNSAIGENDTKVVDSSLYSNNGTVVGALWDSIGGYLSDGAFTFNGSTDRMVVADSNSLDFDKDINITISLWIKCPLNSFSVLQPLITKDGGGGATSWDIYLNTTGYIVARFGQGNNQTTSTDQFCDNQWNNIIVVVNRNYADGIQIYKNGYTSGTAASLVGSFPNMTNAFKLKIGNRTGTGFFNGSIDEVIIYNKSLNSQEAFNLYKGYKCTDSGCFYSTQLGLNFTGTNLSKFYTKGNVFLDFNGVNTDITTSIKTIGNFNITNPVQVHTFAKFNSFSSTSMNIISKYTATNNGWLFRTVGEEMRLNMYNSSSGSETVENDRTTLDYGYWNEFGFTVNTSGKVVMMDRAGSFDSGQVYNFDGGTGLASLTIGSRGSEYMNGSIGEILILNDTNLWSGISDRYYDESKFGNNRGQSIPIIYYHMVNDTPDDGSSALNIKIDAFKEQIDYLNDSGFKTVSMQNIYDWQHGNFTMPSKPVNIQFDDGWISVFTVAYPILLNYSYKATIALPSNWVGSQSYYMNWTQVANLTHGTVGWEVASHATGESGTQDTISEAEQIRKLNESRYAIYGNISIMPNYFVYPSNGRNDSTDDNCALFYDMCSGDAGGYVFRDSNLTHNGLFRMGLGSNNYNLAAEGKWSFQNRVNLYQNVRLWLKFNEIWESRVFDYQDRDLYGVINNAVWDNDIHYFKNYGNETANVSLKDLKYALFYNSTTKIENLTGDKNFSLEGLNHIWIFDKYSYNFTFGDSRIDDPYWISYNSTYGILKNINDSLRPYDDRINATLISLSRALAYNSTGNACNGTSTNTNSNNGNINITLRLNDRCIVLNNYGIDLNVDRVYDPFWNSSLNLINNTLNNSFTIFVNTTLQNFLIYNTNFSLIKEISSNINSNDGQINITLPVGNSSYILDNYNITENAPSRDNDPIWISLSNDKTIHIASNLSDTINVSFYIASTRKCKDLATLTYRSKNGYTFTYYEHDAENICNQMKTTGYVIPIDYSSSSNVLDFTYLLASCSTMNEIILNTISWIVLFFLIVIFAAILSVVFLSIKGYFNLTGFSENLSVSDKLKEINWKPLILGLFIVLLVISVIVSITVLFNAEICGLGG